MKAPFLALLFLAVSCCPCLRVQEVATRPENMPKAWLKEVTSVEKEEGNRLRRISSKPYLKWEELKGKMLPGDQLWYWETPDYHGDRQDVGYCLVRHGKVVVATLMNTMVTLD